MTTVGYGDVYAVSPFGRIISIINALWGAFVISLLVSSIGKIFELSDGQKKAIAQITNFKSAGRSLKSSLKYFIAKKEHSRNEEAKQRGDAVLPEEKDYVATKDELKQLKQTMENDFDHMKQERYDNMDLVPVDVKGQQIETIKEQILDLNDKFDFLISLMIQSNKLKVRSVEDEHDNFKSGTGMLNLPTTTDDEVVTEGEEVSDPVKAAKTFQKIATEETGQERKHLRKPPPKKPIDQRIKEVLHREGVRVGGIHSTAPSFLGKHKK